MTTKQDRLRQLIVERAANSRHPVRLGELYRSVQAQYGPLTLGQFHDALRDLAGTGPCGWNPGPGPCISFRTRNAACWLAGKS